MNPVVGNLISCFLIPLSLLAILSARKRINDGESWFTKKESVFSRRLQQEAKSPSKLCDITREKKKKKRHYTYYLGDSLDAKEVTKNIWAAQNSYGFPSCNGKGIVKEIKKIIKKNGQLVWVKCLCHLPSELSSPTKTKETFNCLKDVH